jgi:hypothetical protein
MLRRVSWCMRPCLLLRLNRCRRISLRQSKAPGLAQMGAVLQRPPERRPAGSWAAEKRNGRGSKSSCRFSLGHSTRRLAFFTSLWYHLAQAISRAKPRLPNTRAYLFLKARMISAMPPMTAKNPIAHGRDSVAFPILVSSQRPMMMSTMPRMIDQTPSPWKPLMR